MCDCPPGWGGGWLRGCDHALYLALRFTSIPDRQNEHLRCSVLGSTASLQFTPIRTLAGSICEEPLLGACRTKLSPSNMVMLLGSHWPKVCPYMHAHTHTHTHTHTHKHTQKNRKRGVCLSGMDALHPRPHRQAGGTGMHVCVCMCVCTGPSSAALSRSAPLPCIQHQNIT